MSEATAQQQMVPPQPLTDSETSILKTLYDKKKQVELDVSTFVGYVLNARQLNVEDWSVSAFDFKTIIKNPPKAPATPLPATPSS
jgi:hypothetical protein